MNRGNKCLHELSNDNRARLINFIESKILTVNSTAFPHRDVHKHI